ncbi:uncharacterized protein METZ01_LOCUS376971, partial [marine metagenome]
MLKRRFFQNDFRVNLFFTISVVTIFLITSLMGYAA